MGGSVLGIDEMVGAAVTVGKSVGACDTVGAAVTVGEAEDG